MKTMRCINQEKSRLVDTGGYFNIYVGLRIRGQNQVSRNWVRVWIRDHNQMMILRESHIEDKYGVELSS